MCKRARECVCGECTRESVEGKKETGKRQLCLKCLSVSSRATVYKPEEQFMGSQTELS